MSNEHVDWNLVALIFMVTLLVGLYLWNRFLPAENLCGGDRHKQRMIGFAIFLTLSVSFTIFMNTGGRPGGIFVIA